jgi:pimeloyl-ACP methyl ester carboxylesterase
MFIAIVMAAALAAAPVESAVEIPGGLAPFKATELAPGGKPQAAVVILPGSGPTDRDGNNPMGVRGSSYRLLAEGLAAQGVASLRMDKRGMFASGPAAADPNAVTVTVLAADANAWASDLKRRTGLRCVWLLGHSEGGLVALIAAGADNPDICGLVLVAAPGRPLGAVIREQLQANPANAPLLPQALPAINELEAGRKVDTTGMHPALLPLFGPAVQGFLIESFRQDPAALMAKIDKPILVLQGETDLQVTVADARTLKAAQPKASLVLLPQVNHLLKVAPADRGPNLATYADPSLPLAPGVVEAIATFLKP